MESDSEDLTASGVTLGTFDYISPEQARDPRLADVRSDLYSLGCTFYFMLTGKPPFPEGTVLQKLLSHSSDDPSDPRHVRPDLDEAVVSIINKLLAKQPDQRYQQPNELVGELLLVARRLNLSSISQNGTVWVTPRRSKFAFVERSLPLVLPVVALLVAVFVLDKTWSNVPPIDFDKEEVELKPPIETSRHQTPTSAPQTDESLGGAATATAPKTEDGDTEIQATPGADTMPAEKDVAAPEAPVEDPAIAENGSATPTETAAKPESTAEPPAEEPSGDSNERGAALPATSPPAMDGANTIPPEAETGAEPSTVDSDGAVEEQ
jgi:serine/threonine-protein kinase